MELETNKYDRQIRILGFSNQYKILNTVITIECTENTRQNNIVKEMYENFQSIGVKIEFKILKEGNLKNKDYKKRVKNNDAADFNLDEIDNRFVKVTINTLSRAPWESAETMDVLDIENYDVKFMNSINTTIERKDHIFIICCDCLSFSNKFCNFSEKIKKGSENICSKRLNENKKLRLAYESLLGSAFVKDVVRLISGVDVNMKYVQRPL